jgi:hypothetical protein
MSREKSVAVSQFCKAVGSIEGLHTLALGGFGTNHAITSQLFSSLSNIQTILLDLPWRGEIQREFGLLIFTISKHPCQNLEIRLIGDTRLAGDKSVKRRREEATRNLDFLLKETNMKALCLKGIDLTLDECKTLAEKILLPGTCTVNQLFLDCCTFRTANGRTLVASALRKTLTLTKLAVSASFQRDLFYKEFLSHLAFNTSLTHVKICFGSETTRADRDKFVFAFIKAMAIRNKCLQEIEIDNALHFLRRRSTLNRLVSFLQENYSLKRIAFQGMTNKSFEMIHRLNRAGRRYLIEDSTSKEACINVLAQVNDDLDCLYFHLRENPVLFTRMTCNADCTQHVPSGTKLQTGTSDGESINVSSKED